MNSEEKKKFLQKCFEALELAERVIQTRYVGEVVYTYQHPAFTKIFEKAYEEIEKKEETEEEK